MVRRLAGMTLAIAISLTALGAEAQSTEAAKQEAQKLYQDAAKDMDAKEYARACPKLEAARKILPDHIRTAMSLAECYDKLGEPATAQEAFGFARALAHEQKNTDKLAEIDAKLVALKPRVPHLILSIPKEFSTLPGFAILRNGAPVPVAQWDKPISLNPGKYQIEVSAVDKKPWKTTVEIKAEKDTTLEIKPPWNDPPAIENSSGTSGTSPSGNGSDSPNPPSSTLRAIGIAGISLGAVGVGIGAILGGVAVAKNSASDSGLCNASNVCNQEGFDLRTEARAYGNLSTTALVVGSVLLASGVVLVVVGGKNTSEKTQASLWVGPSSVGVRGMW